MFNKLKQIKDLRNKAKELQGALSGELVEGTAAWGKVKVSIDGNQKVQKVEIDPEYLDPSKKEALEKAIAEAFADALKKIQKVLMSKMKDMGGLDLPGLS